MRTANASAPVYSSGTGECTIVLAVSSKQTQQQLIESLSVTLSDSSLRSGKEVEIFLRRVVVIHGRDIKWRFCRELGPGLNMVSKMFRL